MGLHWNMVTKKKTTPVMTVMAMTLYMIQVSMRRTVMRRRKQPMEILEAIMVRQYQM